VALSFVTDLAALQQAGFDTCIPINQLYHHVVAFARSREGWCFRPPPRLTSATAVIAFCVYLIRATSDNTCIHSVDRLSK